MNRVADIATSLVFWLIGLVFTSIKNMNALFSAVCTTIDCMVEHRSLMWPSNHKYAIYGHTYKYPKLYKAVYTWTQIVDIGTMLFCFVYSLPYTCSVFMCFVFPYIWLIRDITIVHLNKSILTTVFATWSMEYCNNWSCYKGILEQLRQSFFAS